MPAVVLHSAVHETIGQEIVDGVIPPESVLTLDALQARFGVSRTVMREVMRGLEGQRLVESRRRVGIIVQPQSDWKIYDPQVLAWHLRGPRAEDMIRSLIQLRTSIEPTAAQLAAEHPNLEVRTKILALAQRLHTAALEDRHDDYLRIDLEFHLSILRACRNPLFAAMEEVTLVAMSLQQKAFTKSIPPDRHMLDLHVTAGQAIARGDSAESFRLFSALMEDYHDAPRSSRT